MDGAAHDRDRAPEVRGPAGLSGIELSREVVRMCRGAGFAAAGVCTLEPLEHAADLRAWLAEGKHGSMAYLAEHADLRADPAALLEGARSAVLVADLYASRADNADGPLARGRGRVARYARGADYHKVIKKRLHALCDGLSAAFDGAAFRSFADTAPVPERALAWRAGIGWTGKHTLTIHPRHGSYLLLGGFLTTLELPSPPEQSVVADHCGSCTRCIEACPTDAITPYSVDARRCISYLTIERREPIDPAFFADIGGWVYGCDICQEVCPHNSPRDVAWLGAEAHPAYEPRLDSFDLLEVLGWGEGDRREAFAGSAMKRATLAMMKRNALIVLANQGGVSRERLAGIAADVGEDTLVRRTAADLLGGTAPQGGG